MNSMKMMRIENQWDDMTIAGRWYG